MVASEDVIVEEEITSNELDVRPWAVGRGDAETLLLVMT